MSPAPSRWRNLRSERESGGCVWSPKGGGRGFPVVVEEEEEELMLQLMSVAVVVVELKLRLWRSSVISSSHGSILVCCSQF